MKPPNDWSYFPPTSTPAGLGHNNPPSLIELARDTYRNLSEWLSEMPVIETFEDAKAAGKWIESITITLDELDAERRSKVDPLNAEVKATNDQYRPVRIAFTNDDKRGLLDETKRRLTAYGLAEENRRAAEAEALRLAAEEAKRAAIDAEWAEQNAKESATVGELGVDVGKAISAADSAFCEFSRASRQVSRAERGIPTRIGSAYGKRALIMRNKETLILDDAMAAIKEMGVTEKIRDAILSAARDYRKIHGELPDGVRSQWERSL